MGKRYSALLNLKPKGDQKMTDTCKLNHADLNQFTGTESWYRHGLVRSILFTDGVKYVADTGRAYWLLDEIALAQKFEKKLAKEEFQLWKLIVAKDSTALLVCEDGNGRKLLSKKIPFTDFPLDEISFFYTNNTILLPSEY
jgi:hypothetical protein